MGILTRGQVNISALRVAIGSLDLATLRAKGASRYSPSDSPSSGWGSFSDDPVHALRESLRYPFTSTVPKASESQYGTPMLRMRYYYEAPNLALRRLVGQTADRTQYCERHGVDVILLDEGEEGALTALVSTTNDKELKSVVKPALEKLVQDAGGGSRLVSDYANTDDLDPDIFLWLLYREATNRALSPTIKLSEIGRMESRNGPIWQSRFSKGASVDRADILALVARGNSVFGPSKFSFTHTSYPNGFFEIVLATNLSFSVLRSSEYDEEDLESLPDMELGPHMAVDVWEFFIPAIRQAHQDDKAWHLRKRREFIAKCRNDVRKLSELTGGL